MPKRKEPPIDRYCLVCGEKIKAHECIHYGALSCYSCRAFFRRWHQEPRVETSKDIACSREKASKEPCEINTETRKLCQRCRHDKCLAVGMRPELVLSHDERVRRFGYLRRDSAKQHTTTRGRQDGGSHLDSDGAGIHDPNSGAQNHSERTSLCTRRRSNRETLSCEGDVPRFGSGIGVISHKSSFKYKFSPVEEHNLIHSRDFDKIRQAYASSNHQILSSREGRQLVASLLALHCDIEHESTVSQYGKIWQTFAHIHSLIFHSFAMAIHGFASLPTSDRDQLLKRNGHLHMAYLVSGYLAAGSGWEQVVWLTGKSTILSQLRESEMESLAYVAPKWLLRGASNQTLRLCNSIHAFSPVLEIDAKKAMLAAAMLFKPEGLDLSSSSDAHNIHVSLLKSIGISLNMDESLLRRLIVNVMELCNTVHGPLHPDAVIYGISMMFTQEEESFIQHQLMKFDREFHSVPYGSSLLERVLDAMSTGLMDPRDIRRTVAVTAERTLRLFRMHEEFTALRGEAQNDLFRRGFKRLHALLNMRSVDAKSSVEQLERIIGHQDMEYLHTLKKESKVPSKFVDLEATRGLLSNIGHPALVEQYLDIHTRLSSLLSDTEMFQLMSLICLFTPCSSHWSLPHPSISMQAVCRRYMAVNERRNGLSLSNTLKIVGDIDQMADLHYLLCS